MLAAAAVRAVHRTGHDTVALSGGVFQNLRLLEGLIDRLAATGLRVLTHSRVSCNDGGISLGQVAVAAARLSSRTGLSAATRAVDRARGGGTRA